MISTKELILSSEMVDPYIRNDWWRSLSSAIYTIEPVDTEENNVLYGYVKSKPFGSLVIGITAFNAQYAKRDHAMIAQDNLDLYLIQLIISGDYSADFGDTNALIRAGDIFILDLTRPLDSLKAAGSRITMVVPRIELNRVTNNQDLHGVVLRRESPSTKLLAEYIIGTHDISDTVEAGEVQTVQDSLIKLIAIAVNAGDPGEINKFGLQSSLRQRVIDYIDRNIQNSSISIETLMKNFHVSRSHLYRSFEKDGGIIKVIQDKRLNFAYRMLTDDRNNQRSIKDISYECGFPNVAGFIRLFKAKFGITPSDSRMLNGPKFDYQNSATSLHHYLTTVAEEMKLKDKSSE